jgi:hypothetical protein
MRKILLAAVLALVALPARADKPLAIGTLNQSVVIATGNTFQTVLAAVGQNGRQSLTIANNNASDSCWLYVGSGAATKGTSILLLAGGSYVRYYPYTPSDVIQATCATSNDTLYIDTQ